jgi:DNA-binding PadR family transcriptional regulator
VREYSLTAAGRKQLGAERSKWEQLTQAMEQILATPEEGTS